MVDPDQGKIWLNAPNCVLRIQGIKFENKKEKFSMIDINGSEASMIEGDLVSSNVHDFIDKLVPIIIFNEFTQDELDDIFNMAWSIAMRRENKENDNVG